MRRELRTCQSISGRWAEERSATSDGRQRKRWEKQEDECDASYILLDTCMFKLRCIVRQHRYRTKGYVACHNLMETLIEADTREAHGTAQKVATFKRMSAFSRTKVMLSRALPRSSFVYFLGDKLITGQDGTWPRPIFTCISPEVKVSFGRLSRTLHPPRIELRWDGKLWESEKGKTRLG